MPLATALRVTTGQKTGKNAVQKSTVFSSEKIPSWMTQKDTVTLVKALQRASENYVTFQVYEDKNVSLRGEGSKWVLTELNRIEEMTDVIQISEMNYKVLMTMLEFLQTTLSKGEYLVPFVHQENDFQFTVTYVSKGINVSQAIRRFRETFLLKVHPSLLNYAIGQTNVEDWTFVRNGAETLVIPNADTMEAEDEALRAMKSLLKEMKQKTISGETCEDWSKEKVIDLCKEVTDDVDGVQFTVFDKDEETHCKLKGFKVDEFIKELYARLGVDEE